MAVSIPTTFVANTLIRSSEVNGDFEALRAHIAAAEITPNAVVTTDGSSNLSSELPLSVAKGGTGNVSSYTQYGVLYAPTTSSQASTTAGSAGQVLTSNGSSAPTFQNAAAASGAIVLQNVGLSTSVAASALTINLTQSDGTTAPAAGSGQALVSFRNATVTTGSYANVAATAATSIVVPSSATLGHSSALAQYVWVYALNNAGTVELAVSGIKCFDDYSVVTTTTISAGATSGSVMYSTTGRTNVPCRLIGRLRSTQATAGTWATAMAEVSLATGKQPVTTTDWATYALTIGATTTPPTPGATTINQAAWRRVGDTVELRYSLSAAAGSAGSGIYLFPLPSGLTIDSTKATISTDGTDGICGPGSAYSSNGAELEATGYVVAYNTTNVALAIGNATVTVGLIGSTKYSAGNGVRYCFNAILPVVGWSANGP